MLLSKCLPLETFNNRVDLQTHLPKNVAKCIEVKINIEIQVFAHVIHEILEVRRVLNCKNENTKFGAGDVIEELSHFRIGNNSVKENIQLALQIH